VIIRLARAGPARAKHNRPSLARRGPGVTIPAWPRRYVIIPAWRGAAVRDHPGLARRGGS
jgi:hypothetical protein